MVDEAEARLGHRLGNYLLNEIIGRGGMGIVYRAEHVYIQKQAAVKVLHSAHFDQPDARARFLNEAQAAAKIEHPNIVGMTDFGESPDGTVFLVMAHVEGTSLDRVLRWEGQIPLFRAIIIVNQITRALIAAHAKGVVHRDMKPENIMLRARPGRREIVREIDDEHGTLEVIEPEGPYDFVTILDFGAAKFFDRGVPPLGESAVVIGTPAYMAPETASYGRADARSDIYALGIIFYEMLTGTIPFDGDSAVEIMMKHVQDAPTPPSVCNPNVEITAEAESLILKALRQNPYQTMEEFHDDLQRCYGQTRFRRVGQVTPGVTVESLRRPVAQGKPILLTNVKRKPGVVPTPPGGVPAARHPSPLASADLPALRAAAAARQTAGGAQQGPASPAASRAPAGATPHPAGAARRDALRPMSDASPTGATGASVASSKFVTPPLAGAAPYTATTPGESDPVPLVHKKSGRHYTLPFGADPTEQGPSAPPPGGARDPDKPQS
jgi:serine/threonine-protein kinase